MDLVSEQYYSDEDDYSVADYSSENEAQVKHKVLLYFKNPDNKMKKIKDLKAYLKVKRLMCLILISNLLWLPTVVLTFGIKRRDIKFCQNIYLLRRKKKEGKNKRSRSRKEKKRWKRTKRRKQLKKSQEQTGKEELQSKSRLVRSKNKEIHYSQTISRLLSTTMSPNLLPIKKIPKRTMLHHPSPIKSLRESDDLCWLCNSLIQYYY